MIQRYRNALIQWHNDALDTTIQRYKNTRMQGYNETMMLQYNDTTTQ